MSEIKKQPSGSAIRDCKCKHEFQDKTYGKGRRVFTVGGTKDSIKYTCTVCGKII